MSGTVFTAFPTLPGPSVCGTEPHPIPVPDGKWSRPDWVGQPSGHSKGFLGSGQVAMLRHAGASGVRRWAPGQFLTASQMADSGPLSPELPASRCLCRLGPRGARRLSAAPPGPSGPPGDARPSLQHGRRRPAGRRPPGQWRPWLGSDPPQTPGCCSRWWATARPWPSLWHWSTTTPPRSSRSRYCSLRPPTLARSTALPLALEVPAAASQLGLSGLWWLRDGAGVLQAAVQWGDCPAPQRCRLLIACI